MRSKNHNFQFKLIRVGFESKHDGGELGVVCSVTCCHTNSQLLLALDKINTNDNEHKNWKDMWKWPLFHVFFLYNTKRFSSWSNNLHGSDLPFFFCPFSLWLFAFSSSKAPEKKTENDSMMNVIHKVPLSSYLYAGHIYWDLSKLHQLLCNSTSERH